MHKPESAPKNETYNSPGLLDTNGSPNPDQNTRLSVNWQKKRRFDLMDLAVPVDHRVKIKESEKLDKYLLLAWEREETVEYAGDGI